MRLRDEVEQEIKFGVGTSLPPRWLKKLKDPLARTVVLSLFKNLNKLEWKCDTEYINHVTLPEIEKPIIFDTIQRTIWLKELKVPTTQIYFIQKIVGNIYRVLQEEKTEQKRSDIIKELLPPQAWGGPVPAPPVKKDNHKEIPRIWIYITHPDIWVLWTPECGETEPTYHHDGTKTGVSLESIRGPHNPWFIEITPSHPKYTEILAEFTKRKK